MAIGEQIRDAGFMAAAFGGLQAQKQEFPIKVEGTKTLPYTSLLQETDGERRTLILKLFRPLPPALAMGAPFEMVFAFQDKRYQGRITLRGREGYLRYGFEWPPFLLSSDRRLWKRFPFRPRENVYVTAQDSELPCHGLTGPLTNLSQGGLCFRIDRIVRLEDGLPIRPRPNLFNPGRPLSMIRIHGLVKDEELEARGAILRIKEGDSEIHLVVQFFGLDPEESQRLSQVLADREHRAGHGLGGGHGGPLPPPDPSPRHRGEPAAPPAKPAGPSREQAGLEPLRRLDRRTTRLLLVAEAEQDRAGMVLRLQAAGFGRIEIAPDLAAAHDLMAAPGAAPVRILLVDLEAGRRSGLEAMAVVRQLEPRLEPFGPVPVAFVTAAPDPLLKLLAKPRAAALAVEDPDAGPWTSALDQLLALAPAPVQDAPVRG